MLKKKYESISPEQWQKIKVAAGRWDLKIEDYTGEGNAFGVTLRWCYAPASQILVILVIQSTIFTENEALEFLDQIILDAIQLW
jgi:hypothetical protein